MEEKEWKGKERKEREWEKGEGELKLGELASLTLGGIDAPAVDGNT